MRWLGSFIILLTFIAGGVDTFNSMPVADSLSQDTFGFLAWMARFVFLAVAAILGGVSFVLKDEKMAKLCFYTGLIAAIISGVISAVSPATQAKNAELYHQAVGQYVNNLDKASKGDDAIFNALIDQNRITKHPTLNVATFRTDKMSAAQAQFEASKQLKINQADIFGSIYAAYAIYFGIGLTVSLTLFCCSALGFSLVATPVNRTATDAKPAPDKASTHTGAPETGTSKVTDAMIVSALESAVNERSVTRSSINAVKDAVLEYTGHGIGTERATKHRETLKTLLEQQREEDRKNRLTLVKK